MPEVPGFIDKVGGDNWSIEAGVLGLPWGTPDGERTAPKVLGGIDVDADEFPSISIGAGVPRRSLLVNVKGIFPIFLIASPSLVFEGEGAVT